MEENSLSNEENISIDDSNKTITKKDKKNHKKQKNKQRNYWLYVVTITTFIISFAFGLLAEFAAMNANFYIMLSVLIVLLIINIFFDGMAVAITSCDVAPFNAMASKKIKHAKSAIFLIKNREKVASICGDVIGDICGIVSGACGAAIAALIVIRFQQTRNLVALLVAVLVGAIISALTVGGKAAMKKYAMKHSQVYVMNAAKIISLFRSEEKKTNKKG